MKDTFKFKWINVDSTVGEKEVERKIFLNLMENLKVNFIHNNYFASKFVEIIPYVDYILINYRRNQDMEVPFIIYGINDEEYVLPIPRNNRIIWGILFEYSKK